MSSRIAIGQYGDTHYSDTNSATAILTTATPTMPGGTTCSIARVKISVGTRLRHEAKGVCTLTEVAANGSWVVKFDASGNSRTYKPNSQHNLKVEGGQVSRRPPPPSAASTAAATTAAVAPTAAAAATFINHHNPLCT